MLHKTLIICLSLLALLNAPPTFAKFGFLDDLIRKTAKVADDVPLKHTDEIAQRLQRSGIADDILEKNLKKAGKLTDGMDDVARKAAKAAEARRLLKLSLGNTDAKLFKHLDTLDDAGRSTAMVLAKGGQELAQTLPDLALRGRLIRKGGADVVAAVGAHGQDAAKAALRFDAALDAGKIIVPAGKHAPTLADFGKAMTRFGSGSWQFWQKNVRPHWKIWLASGALTAYVLDPEGFQNAAGELTEEGIKHLTQLAGTAAAAAIRGVGEGSGQAMEDIGRAVTDTYFSNSYRIAGAVLVLLLLSLLFKRVRYYAFKPFRWLNKTPS